MGAGTRFLENGFLPHLTILWIGVIALGAVINGTSTALSMQDAHEDELRNKIAGGWAGKMIGVSYGAPTEFGYNGVINDDPINWKPSSLKNSTGQDDLYVQMSFMMTMDEFGMDAPVEKFGEALLRGMGCGSLPYPTGQDFM